MHNPTQESSVSAPRKVKERVTSVQNLSQESSVSAPNKVKERVTSVQIPTQESSVSAPTKNQEVSFLCKIRLRNRPFPLLER